VIIEEAVRPGGMLTRMSTLRNCASTLCTAVVSLALASCNRGGTPVDSRGDAAVGNPAAVELKVGDPAPAFALPGSDGKTYRLADYKGRQVVVLAWFAKAFTTP
jgi:hypothetical protein